MLSVFDIEADGLNPTKIHCLSYEDVNGDKKSTTDYGEMRKFLLSRKILVGHNIIRWDIPVIERLLKIKVKARLIDTLALSWYLEPKRVRHGLEWWGEEFGIPKPVIDDWENQTIEEYLHRCEQDVLINSRLWDRFKDHLVKLYGTQKEADRLVRYLMFKMDCAREQEEVKWRINREKCGDALQLLSAEKDEKTLQLAEAMPRVPKLVKKTRPKKPFKQDGSRSAIGEAWFNLLDEHNKPDDYQGVIEVVHSYDEPNPNSPVQIKDWLYSLGWEPQTFKFDRNKETGDVRKIEQINVKGKGLCPSIKKLYHKEPSLDLLDGLSILSHRISILKGFLENVDEEGYVKAEIQGFTNTLRFKHKVVVNLPGVDKPYGEVVRGCLIAPEGYELLGSDMAGLEDRTKQHYMWPYDPEYVKEMMSDDFDAHTNFAVFAGAMTPEEEQKYKDGDKSYKPVRTVYKAVNYTCTYGAGGATTARAAGVTKPEGDRLVEAYWKRNWSVKAIAEDCKTKTFRGQKWLFNPVSKFWYSLRAEKDRFSTLNQGTGVYCFDTWVRNLRQMGAKLCGQMHDEVVQPIKLGTRDYWKTLYFKAIRKTNEQLKLNRSLDVSIDFGASYADIH